MKIYYRVVGQVKKIKKIVFYSLGFTTAPKAFTKEMVKNGWKAKDLIFIKKFTPTIKQEYLNS